MAFTREDIEANRDFFADKLRAERQEVDIADWAKGTAALDIVLLDTRARDAFTRGHIRGAVCAPTEELRELMAELPRDKELVTYCWSHT
ncbi:MAG TPA: rhodanese-like domain-containing protein [Haliangiales bacterium]|nr:rhodanese-like domain-containing protein [Haliangiales bacterium]